MPHNVVRELDRDEKPSSQPRRPKRYLSPEQVDALLADVGARFRPILVVCAWAGLRISEALGLVWGDVDLDAGTVTVELQLDGDERGDAKTENSKATMSLLPEVVAALKEHRLTMLGRGIHHVAADALIFVTTSGEPQHRRNVLRAVHRTGDRLGLNPEGVKKVDIHSLRHSFLSNGLAPGMTIPEMALLGRHDEQTLTRSYARVPEQQRFAGRGEPGDETRTLSHLNT